jgi:hypothetical protein
MSASLMFGHDAPIRRIVDKPKSDKPKDSTL